MYFVYIVIFFQKEKVQTKHDKVLICLRQIVHKETRYQVWTGYHDLSPLSIVGSMFTFIYLFGAQKDYGTNMYYNITLITSSLSIGILYYCWERMMECKKKEKKERRSRSHFYKRELFYIYVYSRNTHLKAKNSVHQKKESQNSEKERNI